MKFNKGISKLIFMDICIMKNVLIKTQKGDDHSIHLLHYHHCYLLLLLTFDGKFKIS